MRKYIRPISEKIELLSGINETIFMGNSGDIWLMGPCFRMHSWGFRETIHNNDGTVTQIYDCRVYHDSNPFPDKHFNDGQNWVFNLAYSVPQGTVITCNAGMEDSRGKLNGDGTAVRYVRTDDSNNGPDLIGYSDLEITFDPSVFTGDILADVIANGLFDSFYVNDYYLQTINPNA